MVIAEALDFAGAVSPGFDLPELVTEAPVNVMNCVRRAVRVPERFPITQRSQFRR
jgi:hypothetical protein